MQEIKVFSFLLLIVYTKWFNKNPAKCVQIDINVTTMPMHKGQKDFTRTLPQLTLFLYDANKQLSCIY